MTLVTNLESEVNPNSVDGAEIFKKIQKWGKDLERAR
jgi:hypothetical protein